MSSAQLRVGIIGCGSVARISHIRWYAANPQVASICIADPLSEQRAYCTERWPVKAEYDDAEEMLEREDLDAVSVCSHVQSHRDHAVAAAESGVGAILCEKPMAPSLAECDDIIRACERNGVMLGIGFMKRSNPGHVTIARLLSEGEIGEVRLAWIYWGFGGGAFGRGAIAADRERWNEVPGPIRGRLVEHGGMVLDHGVHYADVFRWWLGDAVSVQATISPSVLATVTFHSGAMGVFADVHNVPDLCPTGEGGYLVGSGGTLRFDMPSWLSYEGARIRIAKGDVVRTVSPFLGDSWLDRTIDFTEYMFKCEIDDFVRRVLDGEPPRVSGADGRAAVEIVLGMFKSAAEGRTIPLPLTEDVSMADLAETV